MAKKTINYVNNKDLLEQMEIYWDTGAKSDKLAHMVHMIAKHIASRPNFSGYPDKEDMIQDAVIHVLEKGVPGFTRGKENPFAYFTTVIWRKYVESIKKISKRGRIKEIMQEQLEKEVELDIRRRL